MLIISEKGGKEKVIDALIIIAGCDTIERIFHPLYIY
jgi:hypothetical protein